MQDETYQYLISQIENAPDRDELAAYLLENLNYCIACKASNRCERWADIFGHSRLICYTMSFSQKRSRKRDVNYNDYDIELLKRFLSLRIQAIDALIP